MSASAPLLEILIPHYGSTELLRTAVLSVLAQDDDRWRLIVVDDSPTEAAEKIAELCDSRVTYISNPTRLGVAGNFQRCLDLASADWVVFMGCDDVLLPNYVATVTTLLEVTSGAVAAMPGVRVVDRDERPCLPLPDRIKARLNPARSRTQVLRGEKLMAGLLQGNWTYFPAIAWRRDVIARTGFRQDLATTLDLALLAHVVMDGGELVVDPTIAFCYRRHTASASSVTAASSERFAEERLLFAEIAVRARAQGWRRAEFAALLHLTSRAHSACLVPRATRAKDRELVASLLRHTFGGRR